MHYTEKMLSFREAILSAGFQEAGFDFKQFHFYRYTAENVAFVLNLKDLGDHMQATYGFTSIAEKDHFKNHGEDDSDIKLRFRAVITDETDKKVTAAAIQKTYNMYCRCTKEEILLFRKERQTQFLQAITQKLKPLGFKKKGAKWTRFLDGDYCLVFEAEKSQWSDAYYFNVGVYHKDILFPQCYGTRLNTNGRTIYNWQLMGTEELEGLLKDAVETILMPIINTPLTELGNKKEVWEGCTCPRNKCCICWVQKNLWEAKENG